MSTRKKQHKTKSYSKEICLDVFSYRASMTAPVCCVLPHVLEMSHYTEEHMYTHTSLSHTSASIYTHVHISVYHTHNQYLCTWTVIHIRIHGSW